MNDDARANEGYAVGIDQPYISRRLDAGLVHKKLSETAPLGSR